MWSVLLIAKASRALIVLVTIIVLLALSSYEMGRKNSGTNDEVDVDGMRTQLNIIWQNLILISAVCLN